jgi:hypothetical protein
MTEQSEIYKVHVQTAYDAVKELDATDDYKLSGYRIVLKSLLLGTVPDAGPIQPQGKNNPLANPNPAGTSDWQTLIASKIGISPEQVAEIYHYTDEGTVELIIEGKDLPKTNSKSTQHVAALLTAGRQALGKERTTLLDVVRGACEEYRVYDSNNFMKYVRQLGSKFRFEGVGSSMTLELTNGAFKIAGEIALTYVEKK